MRILYVLKHNPWGIGGGCYACRNYLQLFSEVFQEAEMDVCICKEYLTSERKKEYPMAHFYPVAPRGFIGKVMTAFTGVMHRHQETVKALLKAIIMIIVYLITTVLRGLWSALVKIAV